MGLRRLLARLMPPRSVCERCGRPWFTDARRPCSCGETARIFGRPLSDHVVPKEATSARKQ